MRWLLVLAIVSVPLVVISLGCSKPAPSGPGVVDTSDATKIQKLPPPGKVAKGPPTAPDAEKKADAEKK
jgi:hypothetical protein